MSASYYREAHGIIIVYDISRRKTFTNCERWLQDIKDHVTRPHEVLLIGNKADLVSQREVLAEEGLKFARDNGMKFMEVSAKSNNDNCVQAAFETILGDSLERMSMYKQILSVNNLNGKSVRLNSVDLNTPRKRQCC